MKVSELMSKGVVSVGPKDSLQAAAQLMKQAGVGSLPVAEEGRLQGIITDRDIVTCSTAEGIDPRQITVSQCETRDVLTVGPQDPVEKVANIMKDHQVRRVPVVEDGRVVGMVAMADLAREEELRAKAEEALTEISRPS